MAKATDTTEIKKETTSSYSFPEHGITVEASSVEEANQKVEAILSANA